MLGERDQEPFFSIVVPAYNRAATIDRAIASCLGQNFARFELVIVDDGSQDGTSAVVARHRDPRIVCVRQDNAGASAARNRGADLARGRFLAFLDSDDEFLPGKLAAFHAAIERAGPAADSTVWYSPLVFQRGEGNRLVKPGRAIRPDEEVGDYLFAEDGLIQTSTLVVPASLFGRVRFDETLRTLEDLDLCLRLEAQGAAFRMLPEPLAIWHDEWAEGRLSHTTKARDVLGWAAAREAWLSERARSGLLARHLVPIHLRHAPVEAARLLATAVRHRSLSPGRAGSLLLRGAAPGLYARLRDAVVSCLAR